MKVSGTACNLAKPFTVSGGGGMTVTFSYAPASESGRKLYRRRPRRRCPAPALIR